MAEGSRRRERERERERSRHGSYVLVLTKHRGRLFSGLPRLRRRPRSPNRCSGRGGALRRVARLWEREGKTNIETQR